MWYRQYGAWSVAVKSRTCALDQRLQAFQSDEVAGFGGPIAT